MASGAQTEVNAVAERHLVVWGPVARQPVEPPSSCC
jgi:hypothetical protein